MANESSQRPIKIAAMESGPGPKYAIPSSIGTVSRAPDVKASPAFSMGCRLKTKDSIVSPGPCYSFNSSTLRDGKTGTPSYSLSARRKEEKKYNGPAPGVYAPENSIKSVLHRQPAYTMRPRTASLDGKRCSPSPNTYSLPTLTGTSSPTKVAPPAFSMRPRMQVGGPYDQKETSPGPAQYGAAKAELLSLNATAPRFSMSGRVYAPVGGVNTPSPAAYNLATGEKEGSKGSSFGIRHSLYAISPMV